MERDYYFHKSLFAILLPGSVVNYCLVATKASFFFWFEYIRHAIEPLRYVIFINYLHSFFPFYLTKPCFVSKAIWKSKLKPNAKMERLLFVVFRRIILTVEQMCQ